MAQVLNKTFSFIILLICFCVHFSLAQEEGKDLNPAPPDYKNPEQFHKFYQTRQVVSEWQIHSLKSGALVVRLKTNSMLINSLIKNGDRRMAEKKRLEQLAININTYRAYRKAYNFSKLYFIYTASSDTLLNGARKNIFLDSTLVVDSTIVMSESFYLLAETDNLYNSSIGFVPESEAKQQVECGSKTTTNALCVVKNKYGHQLKKPFPYKAYIPPPIRTPFYVYVNAAPIIYDFYGGKNQKRPDIYIYENEVLEIQIEKEFSYNYYLRYVSNLNSILYKFFKSSSSFNSEGINPKLRPFLY